MSILSRYVLKEFFSFLVYCLFAFLTIFILIDLVENLDKLIDQQISINLIILNYVFYLPYILVLTFPIAMLLTTMFSLGRLVSNNEVTAMKASGISLYRIVFPLYVFSLLIGILIMGMAEYVVPRTNRYRDDIKAQGNSFRFSLSRNREMDRADVFLANGDSRIICAGHYYAGEQMARTVRIVEPYSYSENNSTDIPTDYLGIKRSIDAESMIYREGVWHLVNTEERIFTPNGEQFARHQNLPDPSITVKPSDFARIDLQPEEMNYFELRDFMEAVKNKGGNASEWLVDLYLKISFPFVSFVIVFFGAPMVAGTSKRGKAASFGIALGICFVYYVLINSMQILGRNGTLQPLLAAWLPNGAFFFIGLVMHLRARK